MTAPNRSVSMSVGLNLNDPATYGLVSRLYWKRFCGRIRWAGIDPEEGFQDVCERLIRRQSGKSRFDPARSSMSNYLFLSMTGICINLADISRRKRSHEEVSQGESDASLSAVGSVSALPAMAYEDLAAEMEIPVSVVRALANGEDAFCAAIEAGMSFSDASDLMASLGLR